MTHKSIEISGTFSYFKKGEPARKGEPIFETGNQKVDAHFFGHFTNFLAICLN